MRGRKVSGPERMVQGLDGDAEGKRRLQLVLEVLAGQRGLKESAAQLKISSQRFQMLRQQVLQSGLAALTPRQGGRPRKEPMAEQQRIEELERANERLRRELDVSQVREAIAEVLPNRSQRVEKKRRTDDGTEAGESSGGSGGSGSSGASRRRRRRPRASG